MRWGVITTAFAGLVGVVAAQEDTQKWNIAGAKLVTVKRGDTAPTVSEEYVAHTPFNAL